MLTFKKRDDWKALDASDDSWLICSHCFKEIALVECDRDPEGDPIYSRPVGWRQLGAVIMPGVEGANPVYWFCCLECRWQFLKAHADERLVMLD